MLGYSPRANRAARLLHAVSSLHTQFPHDQRLMHRLQGNESAVSLDSIAPYEIGDLSPSSSTSSLNKPSKSTDPFVDPAASSLNLHLTSTDHRLQERKDGDIEGLQSRLKEDPTLARLEAREAEAAAQLDSGIRHHQEVEDWDLLTEDRGV